MPSLHSAMCTLEWMYGVRASHFYCPMEKDRDITKNSYHPPPKEILIEKVTSIMMPQIEEHGGPDSKPWEHTINYMIDHKPDVNWLIILVSIVNPDDEIFEPHYKYIRERKIIEPMFDNSDGLFSNMPMLTEKEIRRFNRIRIPREMRFELRKEKLEMKKQ